MSYTVHEVDALSLCNGTVIERQATRWFKVIWDLGYTGTAIQAATASGIPTYCDSHPEDSSLFVKQVQARAVNDDAGPFAFLVQVDYSDLIDPNPLSLPDDIAWDFSESSEKYFYDNNPSGSVPVVNSAGEPFDSLPEREGGSITVTVSRNVPTSFDPTTLFSYRQNINSGSITVDGVSLSARQAKFSGCSLSGIQKTNTSTGIVYYRVAKFALKLRQDWNDVFADQGYHYLSGTTLNDIMVGTPATKVDRPYPLDGHGNIASTATSAPAQLTFWPYVASSFSTFSFT